MGRGMCGSWVWAWAWAWAWVAGTGFDVSANVWYLFQIWRIACALFVSDFSCVPGVAIAIAFAIRVGRHTQSRVAPAVSYTLSC